MWYSSENMSRMLADHAKGRSYSYENKGVGYAFAFGYLSGTLRDALEMLSEEQRIELAKKYGIEHKG